MQKRILLKITLFAAIGLFFITLINYALQKKTAESAQDATAAALFAQIENKIAENDANIEDLKKSLNTEYLQKSHAFAYMIKLDPTLLEDSERLLYVQDMLGVDELHVTDDKGLLLWGTIPGYIGFDFTTSEQAGAFLPILDDPTYELAQEPTPNGAEGKMFQYVGVSREDSKGIVQVGIMPERLDEELAKNSVDKVINGYAYGSTGFVFAVGLGDGIIAAFPTEDMMGIALEKSGLVFEGAKGETKYNGQKYYFNTYDTDTYKLIAMLPTDELYNSSNLAVTVSSAIFALIFVALVAVISFILKKSIIQSLNRVVETVKVISDGNLDKRVEERNYEEFEILSDGINTMVDTIKARIDETNSLMGSQKDLLNNVAATADSINRYSMNMTDSAKSISSGASTQAATVEELTAFCDTVLEQVKSNSDNAKKASELADRSQTKLEDGMKMLNEMNAAMEDMSEASRNISQVIKNVSDIAFQTNILALNASVEAARAGAHGRGFAVVAEEVRNLASKSSEAANSTAELIEHTLETVSKGQKIAEDTSKAMSEIFEQTKESTRLIGEISEAAKAQAESINEITQGVTQISEVVQNNVMISTDSENVAEKLSAEASRLDAMVKAG